MALNKRLDDLERALIPETPGVIAIEILAPDGAPIWVSEYDPITGDWITIIDRKFENGEH